MPRDLIDLPLIGRAAEVRAESIDVDARTVEIVWTTGATVQRVRWEGWDDRIEYDEELVVEDGAVRLERLNSGAAFLDAHNSWRSESVLGSVVPGSARIEGGTGYATIQLTGAEDARGVVQRILEKTLRFVSVGYRVHQYEITRREGQREHWRAVDWEPFEISAVPIPADPGAQIRSGESRRGALAACVLIRTDAPAIPAQERSNMTRTNEPAGGDAGTGAAPATETRSPAEQPAPQTPVASVPDGSAANLIAERNAAAGAERERITEIRVLARTFDLDDAVSDRLVAEGVSIEAARAAVLDELATRSRASGVFSGAELPLGGRDEQTTRRDAVAGALLHRYDPAAFTLSDAAREYRGMTLLELAREMLVASGDKVRGMSRDEIARRALHSTSDFPAILANVTNRTLRQAYEAAPRTFVPFCRQVNATDFKEMHRVQLGEAPQLLKVAENGEFKRGTLGESKESYRIETYGRVVAITRQVLINDDLGAFTRIPAIYGQAIATLESDIVWGIFTANAVMADGVALFHASHNNLVTPAAALDVTAIGKMRTAMAKQVGLDGKTVLNIRPSFLIVPSSLELKAEQLTAQNLVPAEPDKLVPGSIRSLTPIAEPRLDTSSATSYYLAASPSQIDTIEYSYLEGQEGAYVETRNGFDVDGVEYKCRIDFGAKAIDWRGLAKNAGA